MKRLAAITFVLVSGVLATRTAQAADNNAVACGGFPLRYGTTIASSGPTRAEQHASSVIALAAVTPVTGGSRARAWMVWDERGVGWLGIRRNSPSELRRLWTFPTQPDFTGPGVQVRFTPLTRPLPKTYRLTACSDSLP